MATIVARRLYITFLVFLTSLEELYCILCLTFVLRLYNYTDAAESSNSRKEAYDNADDFTIGSVPGT